MDEWGPQGSLGVPSFPLIKMRGLFFALYLVLVISVSAIAGGIRGSEKKDLTDNLSQAAVGLEYSHNMIHEGKHFFVINQFTTDTAQIDRLVEVPAGCSPHCLWSLEASEDTTAYIYEGIAITSSGTPLSEYNNNRNYSNGNRVVTYNHPTISSTGTLLWSVRFGEKKASGGLTWDDEELILKPSTLYLFRTISTGTYWISGQLRWYEN